MGRLFPAATQFTDGTLANPVESGSLLFSVSGDSSTGKAVYSDAALSVSLGTTINLDSEGRMPSDAFGSDTYRVRCYSGPNGTGTLHWTRDDVSGLSAGVVGGLIHARTALEISAGVTPVNYAYPPDDDIRRYTALTVDGSTSQTSALTTVLGALAGYRGQVRIPPNTKFDVETVYAAVPTGLTVIDDSAINWGQPPTYKNKFSVRITGDTVSDDAQTVVASGHHPAIMLLNMGTSGSGAAAARYASILHGAGKDTDGDPYLGWMQQFAKNPSENYWRVSWRLQTPYAAVAADPQAWATATVYAAGAYCISDGGKIYRTTGGGTSGGTAPTGTGGSISDGGVTWAYQSAALNIDSTRMDLDERGRLGVYAAAGDLARVLLQAGTRTVWLQVNDADDAITLRDESRSLDVFSVSDAAGYMRGISEGANWQSMTGTGPNASPTGYGKVANGGATNMSTIVPPVGRTNMVITLRFDDANTTVVHGTGTNAIRLKGATNTTPAAGSYITLALDTTDTAAWREMSRSY